jgi:hypothetical protein
VRTEREVVLPAGSAGRACRMTGSGSRQLAGGSTAWMLREHRTESPALDLSEESAGRAVASGRVHDCHRDCHYPAPPGPPGPAAKALAKGSVVADLILTRRVLAGRPSGGRRLPEGASQPANDRLAMTSQPCDSTRRAVGRARVWSLADSGPASPPHTPAALTRSRGLLSGAVFGNTVIEASPSVSATLVLRAIPV